MTRGVGDGGVENILVPSDDAVVDLDHVLVLGGDETHALVPGVGLTLQGTRKGIRMREERQGTRVRQMTCALHLRVAQDELDAIVRALERVWLLHPRPVRRSRPAVTSTQPQAYECE